LRPNLIFYKYYDDVFIKIHIFIKYFDLGLQLV